MTHNNDVAVVSVSPSKGTVTNITRVNGSKTTCTYTVPASSLDGNGETVTFTITYKSAKLRIWRDGKLECYIAKYPTSNVQDCLIEPWPASSQAWPNSDEPQSTKTVSFKVTPATGTLVIKKESTNHAFTDNNTYYTMSGAKYKLMTGTGSSGTAVAITNISGGTYVSNGEFTVNSGAYSSSTSIATVTISNLAPGSYILVESAGNDTYNRNTDYKNFTITSGATTTLQYSNTMVVRETPKTGSVSITKVSSNPSLTNGNSNYSLSGAVYTLTNTTLGTTYTLTTSATNNNVGIASVSGLPFGAYTLTETTASQGFERSTGTYSFTLTGANPSKSLTSSDTNILSETPITGTVSITKVSADPTLTSGNSAYSLAGAVYTLTNTGTNATYTLTTDANGAASKSGLPLGAYTLVETTPSQGFKLSTGSISFHLPVISTDPTVGQNGAVIVNITSDHTDILSEVPNISASVNIIKTGGGSPLSGAVLQIKQGNTVIDEWTTNGSTHTFSGTWDPNLTYTLHEVSAPSGYSVAADISFTINGSGEVVMNNVVQSNNTITMEDTLDIGGLRIYKTRVNTNPDTNPSLAGAVYAIKKVGDSTWTNLPATDANGVSSLGNLASGTYSIKEVSAPTGFYTNIEANIFTIVRDKETVLTYNGSVPSGVTLTSDQVIGNASCLAEREEKVDLIIIKDAADPTAASGLSLAGAVYSLYKANGTLVGTATTSEIAGYDYTTLANGQY